MRPIWMFGRIGTPSKLSGGMQVIEMLQVGRPTSAKSGSACSVQRTKGFTRSVFRKIAAVVVGC